MKKKICKYCGKEFETIYANFCSRSCISKYTWKMKRDKMLSGLKKSWNEERREKASITQKIVQKEVWKNNKLREHNSKKQKENWSNETYRMRMMKIFDNDWREKMKKIQQELWTPELCEKHSILMTEIYKNSELLKKRSEISKELWEDDDYRNKMMSYLQSDEFRKIISDYMIEKWKDDDWKDFMSNVMKKHWEDNDYRNKVITTMIEKWKDEKYAEEHFKSSVKYKEFTLPSGRIIKLQGYEPQVLEQLLQIYSEEDIVCEIKFINKEIGKILYNFEGKERRYYPDFYIKSTNTIIEVKSQWTFNKWKEKNLAKEQACLQQGFNFEFIIL